MSEQTEKSGIVTEAEIATAFNHKNFGRTDYRNILLEGARKVAVGWHNGWTLTTILRDLKLSVVMPDDNEISQLTEHGLDFIIKESSADSIEQLEAQLAIGQKPKLHALSYTANGISYAITIEGSHEEVHQHARNLGLSYEGVVCEQIPVSDNELTKIQEKPHDR